MIQCGQTLQEAPFLCHAESADSIVSLQEGVTASLARRDSASSASLILSRNAEWLTDPDRRIGRQHSNNRQLSTGDVF